MERNLSTLINDNLVDTFTVESYEKLRRWASVERVLCSIPQMDYEKLFQYVGNLYWILPDTCLRPESFKGEVSKVNSDYFFYISPTMEPLQDHILNYTTAHELGHLVCGHLDSDKPASEQELEADALTRRWGYYHGVFF